MPNLPEPSVPTKPSPSTTDPTSTSPTTTDPTSTSPTTTDPTTTSPTSQPPTGNGQILLGAAGDADGLSAKIGHPLAQHHYADFSQAVPDTDMVTASSSGTWGQVAAMQPGSKMYQDVVRWANELKSRKGTTLFSYSHEPEQSSRASKGGAGDFVRAYRKVVSVMRAQGATNVLYVWQLTGWAFKSNSKDRMSAHSWYPGDAYVDVVGADEYNWYTCGEGSGKWTPLSDLVAPALAFAKDHGKKFALPEFGANQDSKRSAWIRAAGDYLAANKDSIVAVFYFQHPPTNSGNMDCRWNLTSGSEYAAYGDLAEDPAFRT